jgi:hypothetical protein
MPSATPSEREKRDIVHDSDGERIVWRRGGGISITCASRASRNNPRKLGGRYCAEPT